MLPAEGALRCDGNREGKDFRTISQLVEEGGHFATGDRDGVIDPGFRPVFADIRFLIEGDSHDADIGPAGLKPNQGGNFLKTGGGTRSPRN